VEVQRAPSAKARALWLRQTGAATYVLQMDTLKSVARELGKSPGAAVGAGVVMIPPLVQPPPPAPPPAAPAPAQPAAKACPQCGRQVPSDAAFCPYCGYRLQPAAKKCPNCGKDVPADAAFCPFCGAKLA
jgi:RNA polymerase subunit RPABC4/transcription elongation factor Spt4